MKRLDILSGLFLWRDFSANSYNSKIYNANNNPIGYTAVAHLIQKTTQLPVIQLR